MLVTVFASRADDAWMEFRDLRHASETEIQEFAKKDALRLWGLFGGDKIREYGTSLVEGIIDKDAQRCKLSGDLADLYYTTADNTLLDLLKSQQAQ